MTVMIENADQIRTVMPNCMYPEDWVRPLNQAMKKFEIAENAKRVAIFIGQIAHESAELNRIEESLYYSPQRLTEVWPTRFETVQDALPYARNPERLANKVYGNRLGNGPEASGDGYRYRGRGILQITGRQNYEKAARDLNMPDLVEMPDYLSQPRYAADSAAAYFKQHGLNDIADQLNGKNLDRVVRQVTKKVNGGTHGLDERIRYTELALLVFDTKFEV